MATRMVTKVLFSTKNNELALNDNVQLDHLACLLLLVKDEPKRQCALVQELRRNAWRMFASEILDHV